MLVWIAPDRGQTMGRFRTATSNVFEMTVNRRSTFNFGMLALTSLLCAAARAQPQAEPLAVDVATRIFAEREAACALDDGRLWGVRLCGPLLIVDPASREVIANQGTTSALLKSREGVFSGKLPPDVAVANTAVDWDGVRWTMVMWPLPDKALERKTLLLHESFHRIQVRLGLPMRSPTVAYLASEQARVLMRLEWRALARALECKDALAARLAIRDAIHFRAGRRALEPLASASENELELNEGLAEYTGVVLAAATDHAAGVRRALAAAEGQDSFVRSFAYASGPAYGLLLDRFAPGWRHQLDERSDLAKILATSAGMGRLGTMPRASEVKYDGASIRRQESARAAKRSRDAATWTARLVDGRTLRLEFVHMRIEFNPNNLFPLPGVGTVYPTLKILDDWGVLTVRGGALIDDDWTAVRVQAPESPDVLETPEWTLALSPNWHVVAGKRAGDLLVSPGDAPVDRP